MKYVKGAALLAAIQCALVLSVNEFYLLRSASGVYLQINGYEFRVGEIEVEIPDAPAKPKPLTSKHTARRVNRAPAVLGIPVPVDYRLERRVDARLAERQQESRKLY